MLSTLLSLVKGAVALWRTHLEVALWREVNQLHRDEKEARRELSAAQAHERKLKDSAGVIDEREVAAAEQRVADATAWLQSIMARRFATPSLPPEEPIAPVEP